ncbi:VRR-NUC domain-containing protein [Clostridium butyricum]|uniref:VRR-NUC domain protein n=1 Tax=Clostridium butyricum E4 str. BoNT E BL5262 TaxID=632245 RepID=C4IGU7_CLOBU|nr:VRR-NUC domain-containing protein [Clostridium butyricum]EDT74764.1 PmgM [Clostridium butyricum 5521]EEP54934.1 VRR-NUC domain protein [Clostridium butyricum E4 str. BoNT E BL5262]NFL30513.1 VRR-NUC domain-containing protein [Clostridium butyricum]NFS19468.1 VRR-NUC domain-containing protein [Clostridium butyricum]
MTEAKEQMELFQWASIAITKYPDLELMHHVPNGGKRDARTATSLKRQGVKAGVPDIVLPVGRGGYFGLYIELKTGKNKTTVKQQGWIKRLKDNNYCVEVCYGWIEARDVVEKYLSRSITDYDKPQDRIFK